MYKVFNLYQQLNYYSNAPHGLSTSLWLMRLQLFSFVLFGIGLEMLKLASYLS